MEGPEKTTAQQSPAQQHSPPLPYTLAFSLIREKIVRIMRKIAGQCFLWRKTPAKLAATSKTLITGGNPAEFRFWRLIFGGPGIRYRRYLHRFWFCVHSPIHGWQR